MKLLCPGPDGNMKQFSLYKQKKLIEAHAQAIETRKKEAKCAQLLKKRQAEANILQLHKESKYQTEENIQ